MIAIPIFLFLVFGLYQFNLRQLAMSQMEHFETEMALLGTNGQEWHINEFWLDKYEVSIRQYRLCMQSIYQCTRPEEPSYSHVMDSDDPTIENLPVTWVTPLQAAKFCQWLGKRLPSSREWELAARGTENRKWPWGDENPATGTGRVNLRIDTDPPDQKRKLVPVDDPAYATGATPTQQIWHMLGNAAEWTSSPGRCNIECAAVWDGTSKLDDALVIRGRGYLTGDLDSIHWVEWNDWNTWAETSDIAEVTVRKGDTGFRCASS